MWVKQISAMGMSVCIPQVRHQLQFPAIGKGFLYYAKNHLHCTVVACWLSALLTVGFIFLSA